jgi:hypothetical protein
VPEIINTDTSSSDEVKESEMHTALHEIVHLLGGISPGPSDAYTNFIDSSGNPLAPSSIYLVETDPAYSQRTPSVGDKYRTLITTPNVVKFTKQYFGCDVAKGFPLEDLPLGKGVHWEARVAGPELMSYGSNSGEVFISDITLGFLEDTGHYIVDYSKGGSIVVPSTDNSINIGTASQMADTGGTTTLPTPTPLPVGAQRWGLNGGCSFLNGDPRTSIPAPYTCTTAQDYLCTSDNRMSAVCVVQTTWNVGTTEAQSYGGYWQKTAADPTPNPLVALTAKDGGPFAVPSTAETSGQLPKWAQFFSSDAAAATASGISSATAAQTGGFNNAMDYMPVPVGYWNCAYQNNAANSSVNQEGLSLSSFASTFTSAASDMTTFGGQTRCPSCRCLPSSLMALSTLSVNTKFPKYGLCYRTNCPTYNYLQIGIKGQLDGNTYWYGCPASGGKLYIPGFSGALTCPTASTFCKFEKISGLMYAEQNVLYEALFWGIICGTLTLCFFICTCRCLRDRCINCSKRLCGARTFEPPGGHGPIDENDKTGVHLPPVSARVLCAANTVTLLAGIAIVAFIGYLLKTTKIFTAALNVLGMGVIITLLSFSGIMSSRAKSVHGPSCWLLTYFFVDLSVTVLLVYFIAYTLGFQNWASYVSSYYNLIVASGFVALPANATYAEGIAKVTDVVKSNMNYMMALSGCVLFVFLVTIIVAARIMTVRVLTSILLTFVNNILLVFGTLFLAVGIYIAASNSASLGAMTQIIGYICALGAIFMIVSIASHVGVAKKSFPILMVFIVLSLGLLAASAAGVWVCFNRADWIVTWVNAQDDTVLGKISSSMNMTLSKADLILKLQSNLQMLGLGFAVMLILQIVAILCAGLFLYFVKLWKIENGVRPGVRVRMTCGPHRAAHTVVHRMASAPASQPLTPPPPRSFPKDFVGSRAKVERPPKEKNIRAGHGRGGERDSWRKPIQGRDRVN